MLEDREAFMHDLLKSCARADGDRTVSLEEVCLREMERWGMRPDAAEDVMQNASISFMECGQFARLLQDYIDFDRLVTNESDAVFRVIVNRRRIDWYRKQKLDLLQQVATPAGPDGDEGSDVDAMDAIAHERQGDPRLWWLVDRPTPEGDFVNRNWQLEARFDQLTEIERRVLEGRYEEMSFAEIAESLGSTEDAVRQVATRARRKLRARLD
jgi:RNA polymerase sigma factor (sigma-70 family)